MRRSLKSGPRLRLLGIAAACVGAAAIAGCDAQENASTSRGRELFVANCGTCHTLAEAATTAQVGPDLDYAFRAARSSGMDRDTIEGVVQTQIESPRKVSLHPDDPGYSAVFMPAQLVDGQDAEDVATYVASVAGVPGITPPQAPGGPGGQVFANNGCGACHTLKAAESSGTTGPDLDDELPGQSPAEISKSITDPGAKITSGFPSGVMPATFGDTIDAKDLKLLVDFLVKSAGK